MEEPNTDEGTDDLILEEDFALALVVLLAVLRAKIVLICVKIVGIVKSPD